MKPNDETNEMEDNESTDPIACTLDLALRVETKIRGLDQLCGLVGKCTCVASDEETKAIGLGLAEILEECADQLFELRETLDKAACGGKVIFVEKDVSARS